MTGGGDDQVFIQQTLVHRDRWQRVPKVGIGRTNGVFDAHGVLNGLFFFDGVGIRFGRLPRNTLQQFRAVFRIHFLTPVPAQYIVNHVYSPLPWACLVRI